MKALFKNWLEFLDRDVKLSRRQVYVLILLVMIAGFGLRYGYGLLRERQPRDATFYIQAVENPAWLKKHNFYSPLMPIIAAYVSRLGIKAETALIMLNMGYAMSWVLVMFFLCREVFGNDKAGLIGMALAAFNPYSVRMASQILREPLYILLFTLSLWCVVRVVKIQSVNLLYPVIIGVLTVLGFYTRLEGAEILLFLPVALIILFARHKKQCLKQCICNLAVYLLTIGVLIAALMYSGNVCTSGIHNRITEFSSE